MKCRPLLVLNTGANTWLNQWIGTCMWMAIVQEIKTLSLCWKALVYYSMPLTWAKAVRSYHSTFPFLGTTMNYIRTYVLTGRPSLSCNVHLLPCAIQLHVIPVNTDTFHMHKTGIGYVCHWLGFMYTETEDIVKRMYCTSCTHTFQTIETSLTSTKLSPNW